MPSERVDRLRTWHDEASAERHALGGHYVEYLGLRLHVPEQVFPPTPVSDLLGRAVLARAPGVRRALDMGCGAGAGSANPPFRWFRPRDMLERAFADENYETLRR